MSGRGQEPSYFGDDVPPPKDPPLTKSKKIPPPANLYEACIRMLTEPQPTDGPEVDKMQRVRNFLGLAAISLALKRKENPKQWGVYVERHIAGVRVILRDAKGIEVDMQKLPGTLEGIVKC